VRLRARIDNDRASSEDVAKEDEEMKLARTCTAALVAGFLLSLSPGAARCEAQSVEHTIRPGDNLHLIAGYYFGDPRQWKIVWKSNRQTIAGPNRLVPGKVLRIEGFPGDSLLGSYDDFRSRVRGK
jgi:nucleoid-associated protein YgaU